MSRLTLSVRAGALPETRISLLGLTPAKLHGKSASEIASLPLQASNTALTVGDLFSVEGTAEDEVVFSGVTGQFDDIATRLDAGTIIVDGDCGGYAGRRMSGGTLSIKGSAGPFLASRMSGGLITVSGSAGDYAGGIKAGEKFGMTGGSVVVEGNIGAQAGDRMRRGTIIARGTFGEHAASRMMGGTLWTETGFGPEPGPLLRRGTLIGPTVERLLPTYVDGGRHDLVVLGILNQHMKATLGDLAPKPLPKIVQKISGDMATIGKGEVLIFER